MSDSTKSERVPVSEDPKVIAFKWSNQAKDSDAILSNPMECGKLGEAEGYTLSKINAGLASGELIGFVNVIDREEGRTILEVIQKSSKTKRSMNVMK